MLAGERERRDQERPSIRITAVSLYLSPHVRPSLTMTNWERDNAWLPTPHSQPLPQPVIVPIAFRDNKWTRDGKRDRDKDRQID